MSDIISTFIAIVCCWYCFLYFWALENLHVCIDNSAEKNNVHDIYNTKTNDSNCQKSKGYCTSLKSQPTSHPGQKNYSEDEKCDNIEQSVSFVTRWISRFTGNDEKLTGVKEDWINLYNEGESYEGHKLCADNRHRVAENDKTMVKQELVSAAFSMIEDHVKSVVKKVANWEANQRVTRDCELSL